MGVVPMSDAQGQHTGLVEFGLEFGPILDKLKAAYGFDSTFYVREEPLRRISTSVDPAILDEHNRVGEYLKYHSTNWGLMKGLVDSGDLGLVNGEPIQYTRDSAGVSYGLVMVTLRNAAGTAIGVLAASRDFTASRGAAGRAVVSQIAAALFALIILAGAVLISIRGFLLRPVAALAEGMEALAQGKAAEPLDTSGYCEELETIAANYETLRKNLARKAGGA
jgi:methyl-accepting chemotaxis protein